MVSGAKVMQCMRSLFSTERLALCIVALLAVGQASYSTADARPVSKKRAKESGDTFGRSLSAAELRQLYNGRTWLWENGGGYMDPSGRFGAIIDSWNGRLSMVDGAWTTNDRGRLCFSGSWRSQTGKTHSESCFTHYAWGDVIYQRKGAEWLLVCVQELAHSRI